MENVAPSHTRLTQSGESVSQGLRGVRQRARVNKQQRFTALLHHVTITLLRESFHALKRKAAVGVDGVTWTQYREGLEDRLIDLHSRIHRAADRAQPSRRVYIPRGDGRQRPLGIAALEDKIVQQAVVTVLNEIYEVDFRGYVRPRICAAAIVLPLPRNGSNTISPTSENAFTRKSAGPASR
jgi:hypothetical protein